MASGLSFDLASQRPTASQNNQRAGVASRVSARSQPSSRRGQLELNQLNQSPTSRLISASPLPRAATRQRQPTQSPANKSAAGLGQSMKSPALEPEQLAPTEEPSPMKRNSSVSERRRSSAAQKLAASKGLQFKANQVRTGQCKGTFMGL